MSVPEALATTIRILLMFSIVLVHRWNPGVWARPTPSETPHRHPWAILSEVQDVDGPLDIDRVRDAFGHCEIV